MSYKHCKWLYHEFLSQRTATECLSSTATKIDTSLLFFSCCCYRGMTVMGLILRLCRKLSSGIPFRDPSSDLRKEID